MKLCVNLALILIAWRYKIDEWENDTLEASGTYQIQLVD